MRSLTAKLATFGAVALLATIVPTVSANAAGTALGDCPSGYFCACEAAGYPNASSSRVLRSARR